MRSFGRTYLVLFLIVSLAGLPVRGAALEPMGTVVLSSAATLDRAPARVGATLYPGDMLETSAGGQMRLSLGGSQIYLLSQSGAKLMGNPGGVKAELVRGTAGFTQTRSAVQLVTPWATIHGTAQAMTQAQVTMVSPTELVVVAYRGPLLLEVGGVTSTLAEGHSYRVLISFAQDVPSSQSPDDRNGSGNVKARRKPLGVIILLGSAAAAASVYFGTWVYNELTESPSKFDTGFF